MKNKKHSGQITLGSAFFLFMTLVLLALTWPVITSAVVVASSTPGLDTETKWLWLAAPFLILLAFLWGNFYYNRNQQSSQQVYYYPPQPPVM